MNLQVFILIVTCIVTQCKGCSYGQRSQAHIVILTDIVRYSQGYEELTNIRFLAEHFTSPANSIDIIIHNIFKDKLEQYITENNVFGNLTYVIEKRYLLEDVTKILWKKFRKSERFSSRMARVLIWVSDGVIQSFGQEQAVPLKAAGVEIFALGYKKPLSPDMYNIMSYPLETHKYEWLRYENVRLLISDLAMSVCLSIERNLQEAKKSLLSDVRLVGGSSRCDGQVQVLYNHTWGWLYDHQWGRHSADVVCRQLNCGPSVELLRGGTFGTGTGHILEKAACSGHENDISQCILGAWREEDLAHKNQSSGVTCFPNRFESVNLVNGSGGCDGIIEMSGNGTRGRVCAWNFDLPEAAAICRLLGCGPLVRVQEYMMKPESDVVTVEKVSCSGRETGISQCIMSLWSTEACFLNVHAGIVCSESVIDKVRLVNGSSECAGQLEVLYKGKWGSVCDVQWDMSDAHVVCRQLGCGAAVSAHKGTHFGSGSGPIWLEKVYCNGSESKLSQCGAVTARKVQCTHAQDAGVTCVGEQFAGVI
ncbi:scavenger receptor cysteine-rich type 1 protein M130 isoform X2 [Bombina bombina]|uniref:scavenger receptor cysteine-rich type 1 protein M130 isoform X2 n=1 Tax=Bombina bombina TaxID=8345 RepID=UPI00235A6372|nr:scavenger receptor cysteine-rich type 1 protein M130 isoform X2 [Bombina bombina]